MDIAAGEINLEIVEGTDLSNYYNKAETGELLDEKYDADNPNGYTDDTTAKKAQTAADNAAKTATDYITEVRGSIKIAQNFDAITLGNEESHNIYMDGDSIDFYIGEELLGYINSSKAYFDALEANSSLIVTDKYALRKTPGGALGFYKR